MATEKWFIDGKALVQNFRRTKMDEVFPNWKELSPTTQAAIIRLTTKYRAIILSAPIVDAVEVIHGRWKAYPDEYQICGTEFVCSNCNESFVNSELASDNDFLEMMKFCPNCGADMRERKGND